MLLETEEEIQARFSSLQVGKVESEWIDEVFGSREKPSEENAPLPTVPWEVDEVNCGLHIISPWLCPNNLLSSLEARATFGNYCMTIGATCVGQDNFLFDAGATHARPRMNVDAIHLPKFRRIDREKQLNEPWKSLHRGENTVSTST